MPGHTDDENTISQIANFIAAIDNEILWHLSGFYPVHQMQNYLPTDVQTIEKAIKIGKAHGLKYVYAGNVPGNLYENTFCPNCGKKVIERIGFTPTQFHLDGNRCTYCNERLNLVLS